MATREPRYSQEEIARLGDAIYDRNVRPNLKAADKGRLVALDIETGQYEIADEVLPACDRLRARVPDPQIWLVRVGYDSLYRFGGRALEETS